MAINKVIYDGRVLIDLTDSTVTPETLAEGVVAYNAKGERIVGTMKHGSGVTVTDDEKGNVIVTGATATDDGNGNVTVIGMSNVTIGDE